MNGFEGDDLPDFQFQEEKLNFKDSLKKVNRLFFLPAKQD
jgi:hypothetical protein